MKTIVLKFNDAFMVTDERGDLSPSREETGLFWDGTRFLGTCDLFLEDHALIPLSQSIADTGDTCQFDLTDPTMIRDGATRLEANSIHICREWQVHSHQAMHVISLTSYEAGLITLKLRLKYSADFRDVFEVYGMQRQERGQLFSPEREPFSVTLSYRGRDAILRKTHLTLTPPADDIGDDEISWVVSLQKNQSVQIVVTIAMSEESQESPASLFSRPSHDLDADSFSLRNLTLPEIRTNDAAFNTLAARGIYDLVMMSTMTRQGLYPYAGIPLFACPFGRDGLITGLEYLPWFPEVTRGTLAFLAAHQGTKVEAFTDEEPGKILHEIRTGEMANCREIPFIPYYGSIDSTPLFVIALEAYIRWTNDLAFLSQLWPNAEAAARWIMNYGDQDGDTFLESRTSSKQGLINQGWKDSWDAVSHQDGTMAEAPIALCEVQGYAYAAYCAMGYLAARLGKTADITYWFKAAQALQENFLRDFWWEDEHAFYLALDGAKRPCAVVASNTGHCLWSGIVPTTLAGEVVNRLMADDMYSGWGVRTLSTHAARYNPLSYHNGSVWPHDNAIIGAGFARYGRKREVGTLLEDLSQLSVHYEKARLPELFCGFAREHQHSPIPYLVACKPQSWAAGTPFMLLNAILGLEADAEHQRLAIRGAALPPSFQYVELHGLRIENQRIDLRFERKDNGIAVIPSGSTDIELSIYS